MTTVYRYDDLGVYTGSTEIEPGDALPTNSTSLAPPKTSGGVAKWYGGYWTVLDAAPVPPAPDPTEITKRYEQAVQDKLDSAAVAARYDSIATAVSYAEEPAVPKFQKDGIAFRAWRSLVWAYAYEQLAKVLAGEREQPTIEAFLLELPALELPA